MFNGPNVLVFNRDKRLEWLDTIWRADGQLIKKITNKTRSLGRPGTRWIDVMTKDLKEIDQNATFLSTYIRDGWRELLKVAMVLNGPASREEEEHNVNVLIYN